mmetsp:Transcript_1908/g.5751  ORF Transcript_1908/g.5751 Transcript_1908/m.5751 type:complete len:249 (-) Transcript_1908:131-877(-)
MSLSLLGRLEVPEHGTGVRHLEGIGAGVLVHLSSLDEDLLDLHVIDDDTVPPGSLSESSLRVPDAAHSHSAGEQAGAVRKELDLLEVSWVEGVLSGGLLLLASLGKAPLAHDEGIVDRQAVDLVDSALLDLVVVLLVPGQVGAGAGGSEGSRESEDNDPLALEQILALHVLPGEGVGRVGHRVVTHAALEDNRRDSISLLRHGGSSTERHGTKTSGGRELVHAIKTAKLRHGGSTGDLCDLSGSVCRR